MALIAKEIIFLLKIKLESDSQSLGQQPFKLDDSIDYNALGRTIKKKCESFLLAKSINSGVLFQRDLKSTAKKNWDSIFPEKRGKKTIRSMPDRVLKREIHYHITSDPDSLKRIFTGKSKIHQPKTHHTVAWCFDYECWEDFIEHTLEATLKKLRNKFSNIGGYSVLVDEIVRLLDDAKTGLKEESPKDSSIHQPEVDTNVIIFPSDEGKNELDRKSESSTESTSHTEEVSDKIAINPISLPLDDAIRIPMEKMQYEQEQRQIGNRTSNETLLTYQKINKIINFMIESQLKITENLSPSEEEILVEEDFNQIIEEQNGKHLHHVVSKYLGSKGRAKWQWYHRSAIISAVSISFIKRFDEEKANLLIRCINERDSEQEKDGIWQKALMGLLLGLVMVSNNSQKVEMVLRQIKNLSESQELKLTIEAIMMMIIDTKKPLLKKDFRNPYKEDDYFQKTFHWFIPFHENIFLLKNVLEKNEKNVDTVLFASLLTNSVSLSTMEKISVANAFPRLSEIQINKLISIFNEDTEKFVDLKKEHGVKINILHFIELFSESISSLKQIEGLNSLFQKIAPNLDSLSIEFAEGVSKMIQQNLTGRYYLDNEERAKKTLEYYKKLSLDERNQKHFWKNTAKAHLLLKEYNQSIQEFEEYLKFGNDVWALRQIGWCTKNIAEIENSLKKFEIAIQKYEESLKIEKNAWALQEIGWCTKKIAEIENSLKKFEIAIQKFEESREIEESAWALRQIGWCTVEIAEIEKSPEKFEIAIQKFEESLDIEKNALALQQIGWCTMKIAEIEKSSKKFKIAIQKFKESLEIEKNAFAIQQIDWCTMKIAEIEKSSEKFEIAIQKCEESLDIEKNAEALRQIGWYTMKFAEIEKSQEEFKNAIQKFEESLKIEKNAWALRQIGWCTMKIAEIEKSLEKYEKAIRKFKESLKIEKNAKTLRIIGWCYLLLKNPVESKKWNTRAIETQKEEYSYMNLGHCELVLKNKKEALENYKTSLDLWNCSQEFFTNFEDDFQYIEPQGVSKEEYQKIKMELKKYCQNKENSRT